MYKKEIISGRMQEELDNAHQGNIEPLIGENQMTVEYVYYMMKNAFDKVFVPEHILDIFMIQDFPLFKMYEYFADHDYFNKEVEWNQFVREYAKHIEVECVAEKLHNMIEAEYKSFMLAMANKPPYRMDEMLSEIRFMMQAFSFFRYEDCFTLEEMNLLLGIENVLASAYKRYQGDSLTTKDEHYLWAVTLECLGKVVEDERGTTIIDEDALEA